MKLQIQLLYPTLHYYLPHSSRVAASACIPWWVHPSNIGCHVQKGTTEYTVIIKLTRYTTAAAYLSDSSCPVLLPQSITSMVAICWVHLQVTIIIIHQQGMAGGLFIDTKSDTSNYQHLPPVRPPRSPLPRSIILLSLHANIMHPNQDNGGRCPVNGEDAYRTKVHYQHKLCTPNRIRRSLTNSTKHTCAHLHRSRRHRWAIRERGKTN